MKIVQTVTLLLVSAFLTSVSLSQAQTNSPSIPPVLYSALQWRCIGPHRGGRVLAVSGVHGQPNTFYCGAVGEGVWKTIDAGRTWTPIFDDQPVASIGALAVAQSDPNIIYVGTGEADMRSDISFGTGLYKSTDAGKNWSFMGLPDTRQIGRVLVDPKNPDLVYVSNVSLYRSTDGGKTFTAMRGAPGGDDYHSLWIDRDNPQRMVSGVDQGTLVTVNGGLTWSSWYNQPTAQFYHVAVDSAFPYWVYGAQQDSGTAAVIRRSNYGQITFRDWHPSGAGESGYILPDPTNPDIVYGGSTGGELYRWDR